MRESLAQTDSSAIKLPPPAVVEKVVEYDEEQGKYVVKEKIGSEEIKPTEVKSFEDFWADKNKAAEQEYWKEKANEGKQTEAEFKDTEEVIDDGLNSIFGTNFVEIKPQGAAELIFGVTSSKTENPLIRVENQRVTNFDFDQKIQLNVTGVIGEKLKISTNYNTEAAFDFENQIKLAYDGDEDEIIKKVELGHVSMPLNTTLIKGSQSLFGIKSQMQFGKLSVTSILSQQKSQSQSQTIQGGVQKKEIEITADNYEDNKHFFLAHYFRDIYDSALTDLPIIRSQIQITRMEVWITNVGTNTNSDARNFVALMDLGETNIYAGNIGSTSSSPYPDNAVNNLFSLVNNDPALRDFSSSSGTLINSYGYQAGVNFEKVENARKLDPNEYTYHPQLGYISLNRRVEDNEVLAVAFEYTVPGDLHPKQVGEFSTDVDDINSTLFLKLLKSTQVNNTKLPLWDLMMKNVYSTGQYGIDGSTLAIDIYYNDPQTNNDINFLSAQSNNGKNQRWLELLNMDQLDPQLNSNPDGRYDIIDGLTVRLQNGRIYFPVKEPFGSFMRNKINDTQIADQYCFDSLYTVPKWKAKNEFPNKNRFKINVKYESKGNTIRLNAFNIPQGAVTVTAGGRKLQEGVDYRVDYNTAEVTILNQSIMNSNTPITVDVENNSLFSVVNKTLFGTHLDYEINKDFNVGATYMRLTERPLRQKTLQGQEPTSNAIWGVNANYATESPLLTKLVDKIPFIDTKETSQITASGEFAQLLPGSPSAIEQDGEALTYIDDFEAGQINITVKDRGSWILASTPQGQTGRFEWPEGAFYDSLPYGYNRAKFAWYNIDPLFYNNQSATPSHIIENTAIQDNHYMRSVQQNELFPNRSLQLGEPQTLLTFDMAFFPEERGPYNFDRDPTDISSGIDPRTGLLLDPQTRWGGAMRQIRNVDFETQNIEFLEFWVMSPFLDSEGDLTAIGGTQTGGDLYFHLGNISEDILRDGRKAFENGLPVDGDNSDDIDTTSWGRVSNRLNLVTAFDNDPTTRANQDVGLDGLTNDNEKLFFDDYLGFFGTAIPDEINVDPSGDDYQYFRGDDLDQAEADIIERYKNFNGQDGNSPTQEQTGLDYISTSTNIPDIEDVNRDNTLSEGESYYQYRISMRPEDLENSDIGTNYLNQVFTTPVTTQNGLQKEATWYQFRIPIREPDKVIGNIQDFQSIRFMRMIFKNWEAPVVMRFATMDFVQSRWRTYTQTLLDPGEFVPAQSTTTFNVGTVNLEEDSKKEPVRYVMPPNIQRQYNIATQSQENEQAMQMRVCDLAGGDARAMYKIQDFDLISYDNLVMDIHAEQIGDMIQNLDEMNMTAFVRLGSDFNDNYYEYEIPLVFTDPQQVSTADESARAEIWKDENRLDFNYKSIFAGLKAERNDKMIGSPDSISLTKRYGKADGRNMAYVKGSPSIQQVKVLMIGVRNKNSYADMRCAELWVNEFRLSGFDQTGGWATVGNVNFQLADFGNVSLGGGYSTPGWGAIDQKVSDRSREYTRTIDATGSFQLGKFFPEKIGWSVPMYVGVNQVKKTPQFNPLDTDIEMDDLDKSSDYYKYLDSIVTDVNTSRSLNFSNVRKLPKGSKKMMPYSIENFDATFAVNENKQRDVNTEFNNVTNYQGALNYNYKLRPKPVEPFKKTPIINSVEKSRTEKYDEQEAELKQEIADMRTAKVSNDSIKGKEEELKELREDKVKFKRRMSQLKRTPYLSLYRDFNFFYLPNQVSIKNDMTRMFSMAKMRNISDATLLIDTTFNKNWFYNRTYRIDYNLTRAVSLDYSAQHKAFIDEPHGAIDSDEDRDSVWTNLRQLGRPMFFTQTVNANWKIPINKFPWTNWITASAKYTGKYDWQAAPLSVQKSEYNIGNSISNSNNKQLNTQFNLVNLYNKVPYLKKINMDSRRRPRPAPKNAADSTKKKEPVITGKDILEGTVRAVMSLRNVSVTYALNNGTFLPGFLPNSHFLGMDDRNNWAPGLPFVIGSQDTNLIKRGIQEGWFSTADSLINQRVSHSRKKDLNLRGTVEPFRKFRVELSASRTENITETYFYQINNGAFGKYSQQNIGNFSISANTVSTAFGGLDDEGFSPAFKQMEANRLEIAQRLANEAPGGWDGSVDSTGFPTTYTNKQEEVLLYSFLAAYQGKSASKQDVTSPFSKIPIPNWSINYNGFQEIPLIKRYFSGFTVSHRYRSTLNFNGYQNNLNYSSDTLLLDDNGVAFPEYQYQNVDVSFNETFGPLGKIDMRFKNSILASFEYRKSRTVGLNFSRNTVTEQNSYDVIVGAGYVLKDLVLPIKVSGKKLKSNLDLKANVGVKSTSMTFMEIDGDATTTQGSRIVNINVTADYQVTRQVTVRAFYNQTMNNPFIANSYPTSNSSGGLSIRLTL